MFEGYPDVMTVPQVARALSVGKNSIYPLIRAKTLPSFKVGQTTLIPKMSLIDFVQRSVGENFSDPRHSTDIQVGESSPVGKE